MRAIVIALTLAVFIAACSNDAGPSAPQPGPVQTVCLEEFCVDYPQEWAIEVGEDFIVLEHPEGPMASVGRIDMQGVAEGAGVGWPANPENTMRAFWMLLDDLGSARLRDISVVDEATVDSVGTLDGVELWHRLLVIDAPRAWGAELRAPNATWEEHAAIITGSLRRAGL